MAELQPFARELGVSASGPKAALIDRIAAALDGRPTPAIRSRTPRAASLPEPLTTATVIPDGQRSTQQLRAFFVDEIGPGFAFDGHMRGFVAGNAGATLGDAIDHWHATRGAELPEQSASLEFNRFTKEWHREHPDRTAAQARAAWQRYRSTPVDQRPAVRDA